MEENIITKNYSNNNLIKNFGNIENCKKYISKCKCKCCDFDNNYIVLYPGEFESTQLRKDHIKIIDENYFGGKKAICLRPCKEGEFKPLDCKSYPYFPMTNKDGSFKIIKGLKCPLKEKELTSHKKKFFEIWFNLLKNKEIYKWVYNIDLIGYKEIKS